MTEQSQTFEQAMARLEEIVSRMERGDVPLEQALSLFEEGTKLVSQCTKLLDEAELKVIKLSKGPNGEPVESEFDENEG